MIASILLRPSSSSASAAAARRAAQSLLARVVLPSSRRSFSSSRPPSQATTTVGFVGLGNMGMPMARNLARDRSIRILAYDSDPDAILRARDEHGVEIDNIESVGSAADVVGGAAGGEAVSAVVTMLPGCGAVDETMRELVDAVERGDDGTGGNKNDGNRRPPLVVVDCSTVAPSTSRRWHAEWGRKGHVMIDAPVSGGVKGAAEATLTFMVGCHFHSALEEVAYPLLEMMGSKIINCGSPGSGCVAKLCNNLALASQMVGICEAMNLGEKLGVDPNVLADVMNQSTSRCWSSEANNPHPAVAFALSGHDRHAHDEDGNDRVERHHGPLLPAAKGYDGGFATRLMLKDLGLAVSAADSVGVAAPITATTMQLYRLCESHGLGNKDFGVVLQLLRGRSHLSDLPPPAEEG